MRFVPEGSLELTPVMERVVLLLSVLMRSVSEGLWGHQKPILYETLLFRILINSMLSA